MINENEELFEEEVENEVEEISVPDITNLPKPDVVEEDIKVATDGKKFSELSPFEKIRLASAQQGIIVKQPNSSCKKCNGTGYTSTITYETSSIPEDSIYTSAENVSAIPTSAYEVKKEEIPNPCKCIYKKEDVQKAFGVMNKQKKIKPKWQCTSGFNIEQQRLTKSKRNKRKARKKMNKKFNKRK